MFANRGDITPPTQWNNLAVGMLVSFAIGAGASAFRVRDGRHAVDHGGAFFADLDAGDERSDYLAALLPIKAIKAGLNMRGEISEATNDAGNLDRLRELLLCLPKFLARPHEACADPFAARDEVIEFNGSSLVSIAQAP
jgi:hypothetical protein